MTNNSNNKRIEFSPLFAHTVTEAPLAVKIAFREALEIFLEDPFSTSLRNHALTKNYAGIRSIDITADWRALYREAAERIIFVALGTHEALYG